MWTWGQLKMIIFLSFREVRQSVHQIDRQKIYILKIGYTVWIWLFWLQEFQCCTWSQRRSPLSCTRWRTQRRRFTVTPWRISPKSLWSFWLNICGSRMYNVRSNHIRRGSVYTSAALLYDIWYQWLYSEMNNILYILRLPSYILTYAYLWNFCHCYSISIVPSDSFAI